MGVIMRDEDGHPLSDHHSQKGKCVCCVCDNLASGYWSCKASIYICSSCAIDVLPRLVADAYFAANPNWPGGYEKCEREVVISFWKGIASAQSGRIHGLLNRVAKESRGEGSDESD